MNQERNSNSCRFRRQQESLRLLDLNLLHRQQVSPRLRYYLHLQNLHSEV